MLPSTETLRLQNGAVVTALAKKITHLWAELQRVFSKTNQSDTLWCVETHILCDFQKQNWTLVLVWRAVLIFFHRQSRVITIFIQALLFFVHHFSFQAILKKIHGCHRGDVSLNIPINPIAISLKTGTHSACDPRWNYHCAIMFWSWTQTRRAFGVFVFQKIAIG